MNNIFWNELRNRSDEIRTSSLSKEEIDKVLEAYTRCIDLDKFARHEGILALDEYACFLDKENDTESFLFMMITRVVEGTDPELLEEIGMNRIISEGLQGIDGLINLMYYRALLMIQKGASNILKFYLPTMFSGELKPAYEMFRELKNIEEKQLEEEENIFIMEKMIRDNATIIEYDYSPVGKLSRAIVNAEKEQMDELVSEQYRETLLLAMKGLYGEARGRVFDTVGRKEGAKMAYDIIMIGPVRRKDIDTACEILLPIFPHSEEEDIELSDEELFFD